MNGKLRVHSIFESISGEAGFFPQGTWCSFIRLQGCPLRCRWCDTHNAQSIKGGKSYSIEDLLFQKFLGNILITGGEPLAQRDDLQTLVATLVREGHNIQIETNGMIFPFGLDRQSSRVGWVVDYKLASSGMSEHMLNPLLLAYILDASQNNSLKFVVADEDDLKQAINISRVLIKNHKCVNKFIISPVGAKGAFIPKIVNQIKVEFPELLEQVIFSVQIHKLIDLP